tara:strand:+ start:192 stop:467 length:276 start_codon:yes stop_codon:yes gene_type:complete
MAKYLFTRTSDITIALDMTNNDLRSLDKFLTEHGGDETSYSRIRGLHKEIRDMLSQSYKQLQSDGEHEEQFGRWEKPIEYKVKAKADLADA